ATTPRASDSVESDSTRLAAPRILKAPPRCRFSHLKKTRVPASASNPAEVNTGVRRANGRIRTAAARTSSAWMARGIPLSLSRERGGKEVRAALGWQAEACPTKAVRAALRWTGQEAYPTG